LHPGPKLDGVRKLYVVDDRLWRGAQPGDKGFRSLAESGVTTVVDLRPSSDARRTDDDLRALGVESVHMAVTDGQPPSPEQVRDLVRIVDRSTGRVFLHCGEGVGRAGTMSSAYKVTTGQASASDALRESLAIGVLTLEQIAFIRSLDRDGAHEPAAAVTAVSRFLDSPRPLFNRFVWDGCRRRLHGRRHRPKADPAHGGRRSRGVASRRSRPPAPLRRGLSRRADGIRPAGAGHAARAEAAG